MLNTVQIYMEAAIALALMATIGIITGFIAAAATGDRAISVGACLVMLTVSGTVLAARLWRMTRAPLLPQEPSSSTSNP